MDAEEVLRAMLEATPQDPLPTESPDKSQHWAQARRATLEEAIERVRCSTKRSIDSG